MPSMNLALELGLSIPCCPLAQALLHINTHTHTHIRLASVIFYSDFDARSSCHHAEVEIHLWGRDGQRQNSSQYIGGNVNEAGGKYDLDKM